MGEGEGEVDTAVQAIDVPEPIEAIINTGESDENVVLDQNRPGAAVQTNF